MAGSAAPAIPQRLMALPDASAGCVHLGAETQGTVEQYLHRYAAALRYGRKIQQALIRPSDEETEERGSKRTKVRREANAAGVP